MTVRTQKVILIYQNNEGGSNMKKMHQRKLALGLGVILLLGSTGCSQQEGSTEKTQVQELKTEKEQVTETITADGEGGFDWKQFDGSTIVASVPNNVHWNSVKEYIPEFTELTGIKVELDVLANNNLHDKQLLEFSKPVSDFDVVAYIVTWKSEYNRAGGLEVLDPYFEDPSIANPEYDIADIAPAFFELAGKVDGIKDYLDGPDAKLVGLPFGTETSIMAYRKDLFEKYDIKVPETYGDVIEAARVIHEKEPNMYGLSMRTSSGADSCHTWFTLGKSLGAEMFDDNWEPAFDNEGSLATLDFMKEMLVYSPLGAESFDLGASDNAFLQGLTAMIIDRDKLIGLSRDTEKSKVADSVGFALQPKADDGSLETEAGGFAVGIPVNSQNKKAAFLFLQWLTSKETEKALALKAVTPARISTLNDPDVLEAYPAFEVVKEAVSYANPDWRPGIPEITKIQSQFLGVAINQVMTGAKDAETAMKEIVEPVREIMVEGGYIK